MDGQRRIAQSLRRLSRRWGRSPSWRTAQAAARSHVAGTAARLGAVGFLGLSVIGGLVNGGHLSPATDDRLSLGDRAAGLAGYAAVNISITGLTNHDPEQLLRTMGLRPGSSLIGFDAAQAKSLLEGIDWVEQAQIQRKFPNQLDIDVTERVPFAVWQRGGKRYVIDRNGTAMSGIDAGREAQLPLISGEGANTAAADLMESLSAHPDLLVRVGAAARVGGRRWNLYLDNGVKVMLPENGMTEALERLVAEDRSANVLAEGVVAVDMRIEGQMRLALSPIAELEEERTKAQ